MSIRPWTLPAAVALVAALLGGCGGDSEERPVNTAPTVPASSTTAAAPTTTAPASADSTSTTLVPADISTTTVSSETLPPAGEGAEAGPEAVAELVLRQDGIGTKSFGAPADEVVAHVTSLAGAPTVDSGWLDALDSPYGACPGPRVRVVQWGQLQLYFGDESDVSTEPGHFYYYSYGAFTDQPPAPEGLLTADGIGLGSTVAEIRAAYPEAEMYDDPLYGAGFIVTPGGTSGTLTDATDIGRVTVLFGGVGCGE